MKHLKAKLMTLFMAVVCLFACVGVGGAMMNPTSTSITAKAESVYTLNNVKVLSSSNASLIYAYVDVADDQKPTVSSWDYRFYFEEGTGAGFLFNGEAISGYSIKQPGRDFYIELGKAAVEGDTVKIDGTFSSADSDVKFVFNNCNFKFNGSTWVVYTPVEYTTYKLGALALHPNSTIGGAAGSNDVVYFKRADGGELPIKDWSSRFVLDRAENFKINGEPANLNQISSTGDGLYLKFDRALNAGDYITISGSFSWDAQTAQFVVEESSFQWTGSSWIVYVDYPDFYVGALKTSSSSSATAAYFYPADTSIQCPVASWDYAFSYVSGNGITVNGTMINMNNTVKSPGARSFYAALGNEASVGDILKIGGVLRCDLKGVDYVFEDSSFQWDGSKWVAYKDPTAYTKIDLGKVALTAGSVSSPAANRLYLKSATSVLLDAAGNELFFTHESGTGILVNGEAVSGLNKFKHGPGGSNSNSYFRLYLDNVSALNEGQGVKAGDIITIGGTFSNQDALLKYTIEDCQFIYDGSKWAEYILYTDYNLGALKVHGNSAGTTSNPPSASALYMKIASGMGIPFPDAKWDTEFYYESGANFKKNGEAISVNWIESTSAGLYISLSEAGVQVGDVISVEGTFVCAEEGVLARYIIAESKFVWNGTAWENYVEYTTHELGALKFLDWTVDKNHLYLIRADGGDIPVYSKENDLHWETKFSLKNGTGVMLNDEPLSVTVKFPTNMFIELGVAPEIGDKLTIGGTFYNESIATQYVIAESTFWWNGEAWVSEKPVAYEIIELGTLQFRKVENENKQGRFKSASGVSIPSDVDWARYTLESGTGVKINDVDVTVTVQFPGEVFLGFESAPNEGDKLTIGGTFYNKDKALKYVITDTTFWWNGTAWSDTKPVVYQTIQIDTVTATSDSSAGSLYLSNSGFTITDNGTWSEKLTFREGSGVGITLNGTQIVMDDVKIPSNLYVNLKAKANVGDIVVIEGTFYNENLAVEYVIAENTLEWNGARWEKYIEYTVIELGDVVATSASGATALYLNSASGVAIEITDGTWKEKLTYLYGSGLGVTLNGAQIVMDDIKVPNNLYVGLKTTAKTGDVATIQGTFYNVNLAVKYVIEESNFMFNGTKWVKFYTDDKLAKYDTISLYDIDLGSKLVANGEAIDKTGQTFLPSTGNTTKSVAFVFGYNSSDTASGEVSIRLRGENWDGYYFKIHNGVIKLIYKNAEYLSYALNNDTDYVIEVAAIDMADGSNVWTYIKINDVFMGAKLLDVNEAWTNAHVSVYTNAYATFTNAGNVTITYVSTAGEYTVKEKVGDIYTIAAGKGYKTFIGWDYDGKLYKAGAEFGELVTDVTFTAVEIDFTMQEGASIRVSSSVDASGIRFSSRLYEEDWDEFLSNYDILDYRNGTLIMPYDYLAEGQAPNLEDFVEGEQIVKIESTKDQWKDGQIIYRGAMKNLHEGNYGRLFAGRAYFEVTFENGDVWTIYTPFDKEDNVRSIRQVAIAFKADTSAPEDEYDIRYSGLTDEKKAVVDAYIAVENGIKLMNYDAYENNFTQLIAWYYPELDESNEYNNDKNIAIAQKMKDAGMKAVYLDGAHHLTLNTVENIEKTRQIIKFFWSQGLYTIAFQANAAGNLHVDYAEEGYPDFSDCEGFMGFLAWDEPTLDYMATIAEQARKFEEAYAGTGVTFMVNLLPSYAGMFNGTTHWWESQIDTLKKDDFKAYLQAYCEQVLSQVSGEKWLSLDTYPIQEDQSLLAYFLFDLGMLKLYAEKYDAHAHAVLQSSGWTDSGKNRMPNKEELLMQAYTAMAFGVDSISWWSYSDKREDNQKNPTDNDEYYQYFAEANNELTAISKVYGAFDWKGVIIGMGAEKEKTGSGLFPSYTYNDDYDAYNTVKGQMEGYELSVTDTKYLASVSGSVTTYNYLMGVMEDAHGNEGYVLCNYNSFEENRAQTITLTFDSNVTEVVIYRGGVAQTVSVTNKTLAVELATGEGVIILPSKLG